MSAKVAVLVYSLYGHQVTLSKQVEAGLKAAGVEYKTFQVRRPCVPKALCTASDVVIPPLQFISHQIEEILSEDVLAKMYANKVRSPQYFAKACISMRSRHCPPPGSHERLAKD